MGTWNYRVVRSIEPDGSRYYTIREGHYDKPMDVRPVAITATAAYPGGTTLIELRKDLALMCAACDNAVLADEDWPAQPAEAQAIAVSPERDRP